MMNGADGPRTFDTREQAIRFLSVDRTFTYEAREERGFDLYTGPQRGERAALLLKDGNWLVAFWQE